jgi:hypothetical protein
MDPIKNEINFSNIFYSENHAPLNIWHDYRTYKSIRKNNYA